MSDLGALNEAVATLGRIAELMLPGLEALPLEGHEWHDFSVRLKRNEDGTLALHGMRLIRQTEERCTCPVGRTIYTCAVHGPKTKPTGVRSAYDLAMQAAGVPHEPLQVYDSNSYRRVGLASQYREVMWPTNHPRDGHADITGEDVLRAMVAAFNAMLELRRAS